jgi:uncharacterized integral membrane protein
MAGIQNTVLLQIKFAWWTRGMSLSVALTWAAVTGAAIMAVLSLPRLSAKIVQARRL